MTGSATSLPPWPGSFRATLLDHLPPGVAAPSEAVTRQMESHARLLLRWEKVGALTSIRDPEEIVRRHFAESIAALPWLGRDAALLDIGSGAGFPGLPLHMARGCTGSLTLAEARAKKAEFLRAVISQAGVARAVVLETHIARPADLQGLGAFDAVSFRAIPDPEEWVGRLPWLLRKGGTALCYVGGSSLEGMRAAASTSGFTETARVLLPGAASSSLLVLARA